MPGCKWWPVISIVRGSEKPEYWFEEQCFITEWLNDPADPAISVARARVLPGVTTRWHRLTGITERYVVLSGAGQVQIGQAPAQQLLVGDSALIAPNVAQRITNTGSVDLVFLAICTPRFVPQAYQSLDQAAPS